MQYHIIKYLYKRLVILECMYELGGVFVEKVTIELEQTATILKLLGEKQG